MFYFWKKKTRKIVFRARVRPARVNSVSQVVTSGSLRHSSEDQCENYTKYFVWEGIFSAVGLGLILPALPFDVRNQQLSHTSLDCKTCHALTSPWHMRFAPNVTVLLSSVIPTPSLTRSEGKLGKLEVDGWLSGNLHGRNMSPWPLFSGVGKSGVSRVVGSWQYVCIGWGRSFCTGLTICQGLAIKWVYQSFSSSSDFKKWRA